MKICVSQGFIIIGYFIFFVSRFRKNKKSILMADTISRICFIAGYYLFNNINSIEHTVFGIFRNTVGQSLIPRKKTIKVIGFSIMLLALCIMYGLSFNGISTIIFMLSGLINLYAIIFTNEQGIRLGTIFASVCNTISFLMIGSYASILGEALCGIAGILSFLTREQKEKRNLSDL